MIPVSEAMTFDRVREAAEKPRANEAVKEDEQGVLDYLDACIESGMFKAFDGGMVDIKVPIEFTTPEVIGALKAKYEHGGWSVTVFRVFENPLDSTGKVLGHQIVIGPGKIDSATETTVAVEAALTDARRPMPRVITGKPRAMLVSDVPGWAFDQNMHDMAEYLVAEFEFDYFYTENWFKGERPKWDDFDIIYEAFHRNPHMGIPMERALGALRSEWWHPEKRVVPGAEEIARVNKYRGFQVAMQRNFDELSPHCPGVVYLTNPVNMRRFQQTQERDEIIASWNGNARHQSPSGAFIKHFYDIAMPACSKAKVQLAVAEFGTKEGPRRRRTSAEMSEFYQSANVALCTSEYEAASNSVMEAMASGLALLVTDVGNHREMRDAQIKEFGDTGILLIERDVNAFASALRELSPKRARQMGEINRSAIAKSWSWDAWAPRYSEFLEMALR